MHGLGICEGHDTQSPAVNIKPLEILQPLFACQMTAKLHAIEIHNLNACTVRIKEDISTGVVAMQYAALMQFGCELTDGIQYDVTIRKIGMTNQIIETVGTQCPLAGVPTLP